MIMLSPKMGAIPTEKEVAPVLGMAKKGPIDKYNSEEYTITNHFEIGAERLLTSSEPDLEIAMTPSKGNETPVKQKPRIDQIRFFPEYKPRKAG
ncbi:hypothetical protein SuUB85_00200 [Streptococcus uberis]